MQAKLHRAVSRSSNAGKRRSGEQVFLPSVLSSATASPWPSHLLVFFLLCAKLG